MGNDALPILIGSGLMLACAARLLYSELFFDFKHTETYPRDPQGDEASARDGYFRRNNLNSSYSCMASPPILSSVAISIFLLVYCGHNLAYLDVNVAGSADSAETEHAHFVRSFGVSAFLNDKGLPVSYSSEQKASMGLVFGAARFCGSAAIYLGPASVFYALNTVKYMHLPSHVFAGAICLICGIGSALMIFMVFNSAMCGPNLYIELQSEPLRPNDYYQGDRNETYRGTGAILHDDISVTCSMGTDSIMVIVASALWLIAAIDILTQIKIFYRGSNLYPLEGQHEMVSVHAERDDEVETAENEAQLFSGGEDTGSTRYNAPLLADEYDDFIASQTVGVAG
eukprot:CAMPEP_0119006130 /NCGR_PEP_ID=MMETSP1176-20130426/2127_1 /TAXON_ID=265551 /ORGANISM="Synedropsis recta cf, Strain CCMP1620" /LENGTH=341 /DNA_ID=CAMNT_0006958019 /DNA_START=770 /DNA_END=1796 /DNA_ORIENTATION=-